MKIVRYSKNKNGNYSYGVLENNLIHPINGSPNQTPIIYNNSICYSFNDLILSVPCEPTKVIAFANNYSCSSNHSKEILEPLVFIKGSNAVVSYSEIIQVPFLTKTWGEAELGFVIKKTARNIKSEKVSEYLLGYLTANDVTCENVEKRDHHLARSKSADGFCPVSYYIDTDYYYKNKSIIGYHNDIMLRKGNTNEMIWYPEKILIWLSRWMTLYPGDIILTGTPPRVRNRLFLKNGDEYTVEIEGFPKLISKFQLCE